MQHASHATPEGIQNVGQKVNDLSVSPSEPHSMQGRSDSASQALLVVRTETIISRCHGNELDGSRHHGFYLPRKFKNYQRATLENFIGENVENFSFSREFC
uniref:Uncharacterized protein n=1 Tax=Cacopsylla melanoneura TaxID=428564 RepID=A0A8D8RNC7_9HEMI